MKRYANQVVSLSDPDLVTGDGIYSLHLSRYPSFKGRYTIDVSVDDNENRAYVAKAKPDPKKSDNPLATCCGSVVVLSQEQTQKTGIFRRTAKGPSITLDLDNASNMDILPPSKIGDLSLTPMSGKGGHLMAKWTAPGGDYNTGSVASYRFLYSTDLRDLLREDKTVLFGFDRREPAGTASSIDFAFEHYDQDFYIGLIAMDLQGNAGKISNLVHIRVPKPPSLIRKEKEGSASPVFSLGTGTMDDVNWILIGAIAGVISVLMVISIVSVGYYIFISRRASSSARRRKSESDEETHHKAGSTSSVMNSGEQDTDSSSFDSDIKNIIMGNPLPSLHAGPAPVHNQLQQVLQQNQGSSVDSGMSSNGHTPTNSNQESAAHTPVYWSASQLLSKLEHSTHSGPYGGQGPFIHNGLVSTGPHSLQGLPVATTAASGNPNGPQSLHNISYDNHLRGYNTLATSGHHDYGQIPEEYTITVTGSLEASGNGNSGKVPPPVMPKPRNITQV